MIGTRLKDRYRVEALIGQGGMGLVYRALDEQTQQMVAVKILSPRPGRHDELEARERRFRRELRALSTLSHPHIVSVYDHGQVDDVPFFVMEYVAGGDLRGLMQASAPDCRLAPAELLPLAIQLVQALSYIHSQGVVHRDLKPENVLVAAGRDPRHLKLTDFGLAQLAGPELHLTQAGELLGTVLYMAPEQARGRTVDRRADLYALGIILYEALAGRHPFPGSDPVTVLMQQINVAPPSLCPLVPGLPQAWQGLVGRLLAKEPADRFGSAEEVLVILRSWADTVSTDNLLEPQSARVELIFRAPLVGREVEMSRLREALRAARAGQGPVVFIRGEAGVGKTRLVQDFAGMSHGIGLDGGLRLWLGKSYEAERLPYQPFAEILRQCYHQVPELWHDAARIQPLIMLLPERAADPAVAALPALPALDAEAEKYRLFNAVAGLLAEAAARGVTLLCLDDVQWADAASLELFAYLARTLAATSLLLIATYRGEEVAADHPVARLQQQLARQRPVTVLELECLDRSAVNWMVGAMFGDLEAAEQLGGLVYEEAEGNPFFAEEIVKALVQEGAVFRAGGQWRRRDAQQWWVPAGIRSLLEYRLSRLTEPARSAVAVASAIGRQFDFDTLRLAGRFDEDTLLDTLDELLRARVIREDPTGRTERYDFTHDKIREVAYGQLSPARRTRLHRRVAEALEQRHAADLGQVAGELARHHAEAGELDTAVTWAERAAQAAGTRLAMAEVLDRYLEALGLLERLAPDPERRWRLLLGAHMASVSLGRRDSVDALGQERLALADAQGWPARHNQVLLGMASFYIQTGDLVRSEALCREAMPALDDDPGQLAFALVILGLAIKDQGRLGEAKQVLQQCIDHCAQTGVQRYHAVARRELGNVHVLSGELNEGLGHQRAALDTLRAMPDADMLDLAFTLSDMADTLYLLGEYEQAAACQTEALALARQTGHLWAELGTLGALGHTQVRLGQWGPGRASLQAALDGYRRLSERPEQIGFALALAEMNRHLGDLDRSRALIVDALLLAQRRGATQHECAALSALVVIEAQLGHYEAADAYAREAAQLIRPGDLREKTGLCLARGWLALAAGDGAGAVAAADQVLDAGPVPTAAPQAEALVLRGLALGSAADLQAGWEAAGQARVQPLRWRAGLALAELHRAAGRSDDAAAWQRAAQAEIEAVAATFDGPAFRAALLRHALASPLPLPSDPLLPRGEKGQG